MKVVGKKGQEIDLEKTLGRRGKRGRGTGRGTQRRAGPGGPYSYGPHCSKAVYRRSVSTQIGFNAERQLEGFYTGRWTSENPRCPQHIREALLGAMSKLSSETTVG